MDSILHELLSRTSDPEQISDEIQVLTSIYGDSAIQLWTASDTDDRPEPSPANAVIRLQFDVSLPEYEDIQVQILVSVPQSYPSASPPQLQLLSRYIGAFGSDSQLFGSILRTYMSSNGVEWVPGNVCIFDGLQNALEACSAWYRDHLTKGKVEELIREDERSHGALASPGQSQSIQNSMVIASPVAAVMLPDDIKIIEAEAIVDRKSSFVGRTCRISHPSQVPLILNHLVADRRISRAAHPIINAWRCKSDCSMLLVDADNDDDGETAAGGRLAHLLQILELDDVLVIVTRYFGGIHLGPDRFKHINQAARNALELGGFLDSQALPVGQSGKSARGKRKS